MAAIVFLLLFLTVVVLVTAMHYTLVVQGKYGRWEVRH